MQTKPVYCKVKTKINSNTC